MKLTKLDAMLAENEVFEKYPSNAGLAAPSSIVRRGLEYFATYDGKRETDRVEIRDSLLFVISLLIYEQVGEFLEVMKSHTIIQAVESLLNVITSICEGEISH